MPDNKAVDLDSEPEIRDDPATSPPPSQTEDDHGQDVASATATNGHPQDWTPQMTKGLDVAFKGGDHQRRSINSDIVKSVKQADPERAPPPPQDKDKPVMTVDLLLDKLGSPGLAQILIYCLLCLNVFPVSLNFMAMSVYGKRNNETCFSGSPKANGISQNGCLNNATTTDCIEDAYSNDTDSTSQWALGCEEKYKISLAQTLFFGGVMVGGLIFGVLADRFGRRPVTLVTVYTQAVLGVVLAFSPNYVMFVILKIFQGMMIQGLQTSNNTMVMELFQTRYRTKAGMGIAMLATSCSMVIGLLSFLVPYWSDLQLAISVPSIITIVFLWLLPESLRWLLTNQKEEAAVAVAQKYTKMNKIELPPEVQDDVHFLSQQIASNGTQTFKGNVLDLMKIPKVRRTSIILFYGWFTAAVVYYGITFDIPQLSGNMSLNFFIGGALETTARFIGYFIISRFGRRIPLSICFVLSGILCTISGSLNATLDKNDPSVSTAITIMALFGRASMGQCFAFILIVTSEVFPTVLRTVGSGACAVCTRIGVMLAPQILLLRPYVWEATPFIFFGALAIVAGGLILLIPETLNVPLPDTVKDTDKCQDPQQGIDNAALENDTANVENGLEEKKRPT